jgi:hypothetical protein
MAASVITTYCYFNSGIYYSRCMALSAKHGILTSSGGSLKQFIDSFGGGIR